MRHQAHAVTWLKNNAEPATADAPPVRRLIDANPKTEGIQLSAEAIASFALANDAEQAAIMGQVDPASQLALAHALMPNVPSTKQPMGQPNVAAHKYNPRPSFRTQQYSMDFSRVRGELDVQLNDGPPDEWFPDHARVSFFDRSVVIDIGMIGFENIGRETQRLVVVADGQVVATGSPIMLLAAAPDADQAGSVAATRLAIQILDRCIAQETESGSGSVAARLLIVRNRAQAWLDANTPAS